MNYIGTEPTRYHPEISGPKKNKFQIPKKTEYDASIGDFRIAKVLDNLDLIVPCFAKLRSI